MDEAEQVEPATPAEWSAWLAASHAQARGVWLVTPRRQTGRTTVDYETAVVEALRYGWVDSTTKVLDAERAMMWFAPRRPTSGWAASNKARVARLESEGRMEAAGRRAVQAAKDNGSWALLDDVERLVVPDDLADALASLPGARERWDAAAPSARKQALTWIVMARRADTRARRIAVTAERAAAGEPVAG